jgi:hypothetical protein
LFDPHAIIQHLFCCQLITQPLLWNLKWKSTVRN